MSLFPYPDSQEPGFTVVQKPDRMALGFSYIRRKHEKSLDN